MKYTVFFTPKESPPNWLMLWEMGRQYVGNDIVKSNVAEGTPWSLVEEIVQPHCEQEWFAFIHPHTALEMPVFDDTSRVKVECPRNWFNQFMEIACVYEHDEVGELTAIKWHWELNEFKAMDAWKDDGCPTKWGFPQEQDDENTYDDNCNDKLSTDDGSV